MNSELPRILVVDDELLICELIFDHLSDSPYTVFTESDPTKAFEFLQTQPIDMVLTDLKLGDYDGMQVLRCAKQFHPDVAVVLMTGFPTLENAVDALKSGAYDYITKPFSLDQLGAVVRRALEHQRLERENIQLREMLAFQKISEAVGGTLRLQTVLEMVLETALREVEGDAGVVVMHAVRERRLAVGAVAGITEECVRLKPFRRPAAYQAWLAHHQEPHTYRFTNGENRDEFLSLTDKQTKALLSVPLKAKGELIGSLYLSRRGSPDPFNEGHLKTVSIIASQAARAIENAQLYRNLENDYLSIIRALANAVEARDPYTRGHSDRVVKYTQEIGQVLGFDQDCLNKLKVAAILHDIGKIGIHDSILLKPGPLSDSEYAEMKLHPIFGDRILEPIGSLQDVRLWVYQHHERMDGKGYPEGIGNQELTMQGRALIVAEVFDALVSERAYKPSWPLDRVLAFLREGAGTHFDPDIVRIFTEIIAAEGDTFYRENIVSY